MARAQVPTGEPGFDPLPAALAAEEPQGRGWLDPVGHLFDFVKWRTSMAGLQVWHELNNPYLEGLKSLNQENPRPPSCDGRT